MMGLEVEALEQSAGLPLALPALVAQELHQVLVAHPLPMLAAEAQVAIMLLEHRVVLEVVVKEVVTLLLAFQELLT
jgi:hypothetical protein